MREKFVYFFLYCTLFILHCSLNSCGIYSFSGASIPKEVKTISIDYIQNKAPNAWSSIDNIFNQELRNKMSREAGLKVLDAGGDYQLKGYISNYVITPQTPTTGSFSNKYRLDITVQLEFKDQVSEKKVQWTESFTNFELYDNDISGKEDILIRAISQTICNSIYNKIFSTW
jgi:hypothetical protein